MKPREFWLSVYIRGSGVVHFTKTHAEMSATGDELIHVIEKSAYDELAVKVERLEEMLETLNRHVVPGEVDTIDSAKQTYAELADDLNSLRLAKQELLEALKMVCNYLKHGKVKFAPNTTNSLVDDFIEKWSAT